MANESTEQHNGGKSTSRRKPSTGFPVVALPEAAEIVRKAGSLGFEHSIEAFAKYMGHSTTNSGAFRQRLAALRAWNVITGRGDTVAITEIGQKLAVPGSDEDEQIALREAFLSCEVFAQLHTLVAKRQPIPAANLGAKAVHDLGVAPRAREKFVESFTESAIAAGLARSTDDGQIELLDSTSVIPAHEEHAASTPPESSTRVGSTPQMPASAPIVLDQRWPIEHGEIVLTVRSSQRLPARAFGAVGEIVAGLDELAASLKPASAQNTAETVE